MPVVDLADYLGMPAQAPQQPMFQTTQRMAPALSQADLIRQNTAAFETLGNLQRLAPVVQAQQAQLAYDTVAQQARDLRMKQEIEAQAERAVNEMIGAGVTPESADYSTRMRDLVTRNPLALRDPGFQQIAALYEDQSRSFQQAREAEMASEAAYQKALNEDILRATEAGVDPRLLQGVQDRQMVAYLKSQLPRGGRTGTDPEERRLRNQADVAQKRFDALSKSLTASEEQIADAERSYLAALDNLSQYDPSAVAQQQATTQAVLPPMAAAANAATKTVTPAPAPAPTPPPVEQTINLDEVPFDQAESVIKKAKQDAEIARAKEESWNKAQLNLEKSLERLYPGNYEGTNYSRLRRLAKAINDDELTFAEGMESLDRSGAARAAGEGMTVAAKVIDELGRAGVPIKTEAFTEPGTGRKRLFGLVGDQRVPYDELLKVWAKNYLDRSAQTRIPTAQPTSPDAAKTIEGLLGDKYGK